MKKQKDDLQVKNGEIVVSVCVVRMRSDGVMKTTFGFFDGRFLAPVSVVQLVGLGQQNRPQIVERASVVGPQSANQRKFLWAAVCGASFVSCDFPLSLLLKYTCTQHTGPIDYHMSE